MLSQNGELEMKKLLVLGFAAMMITAIGATCVFARGTENDVLEHTSGMMLLNHLHNYCNEACDHVDENHDGICDQCGRYHANSDGSTANTQVPCTHIDVDHNGYCDVCGTYHGNANGNISNANQENCPDFIDNDGDGYCGHHAQRMQQRQGNGHHYGRHH